MSRSQPGTFSQRIDHEKDRRAKWGSTVPPGASGRSGDNRSGNVNRIKAKDLIPPANMKVVDVSSENIANSKFASQAIDGDPNTIWHSQFSDELATHPHDLVIDLGASYKVRGFWYLAHQDSGWNGAFGETEFFVSESPTDFGDPVAKATFGKVRRAQSADCDRPVRGRYVRVRGLSEVNGNAWGSAAEIGVVGTK